MFWKLALTWNKPDLNNTLSCSLLWSLVTSCVEIFQEVTLFLVNNLLAVGESFISLNHASAHWSDLVKNDRSPNVTLLDIVESFISTCDEVIDCLDISHLTMLSPVASELQFGQLRVGVLPVAQEVNDERHVSAILPEETQALEVRFDHRARTGCSKRLSN